MSDPRIVTKSGRAVNPLDPDPDTILIEDIAHALSNSCRFTGHVSSFYSVAQHSVLVARSLPKEHALWGLLHDASEAYLSDLARPIKQFEGLGATYRRVEKRLMQVIAKKFGLPWPEPKVVKEMDNAVLAAEIHFLMPAHELFTKQLKDLGMSFWATPITPWTPRFSYDTFLLDYGQLTR